jgi:hypothetical protein
MQVSFLPKESNRVSLFFAASAIQSAAAGPMLQQEFRQISGRSAKKRLSERSAERERRAAAATEIIKRPWGSRLHGAERCDLFAPEKANISEMILPRRMNATHDYLLLRDLAATI